MKKSKFQGKKCKKHPLGMRSQTVSMMRGPGGNGGHRVLWQREAGAESRQHSCSSSWPCPSAHWECLECDELIRLELQLHSTPLGMAPGSARVPHLTPIYQSDFPGGRKMPMDKALKRGLIGDREPRGHPSWGANWQDARAVGMARCFPAEPGCDSESTGPDYRKLGQAGEEGSQAEK